MSINVARLGWAAIAIEATGGVPVAPVDYIPYVANTLRGKSDNIEDISARGLRDKVYNSVLGKTWGEGDFTMNLDSLYSGYLFKMALGTEAAPVQQGGAGVYDHTFSVNEASTPTSASLIFNKVAFQELFTYAVVDTLELDVKDGLGTLKAGIKSQFPVTSTSGTNTTTSGTIFTFRDMTIQFGTNVAAAQTASQTRVLNCNLKINTSIQPISVSNSGNPQNFIYKGLEVTGEYGLTMQDKSEVNNYYNLTKQCMIIKFTGAGIGGGLFEGITITLYKTHVDDLEIETGIDNYFATKSKLMAEYSVADSKTLDVVLRNRKSSSY